MRPKIELHPLVDPMNENENENNDDEAESIKAELELSNGNNGSNKNKKLFPQKLWDLINNKKYRFCLRWSDDGQLVYLNRDEFEDCYLRSNENQFHTQKAISFVRQMNMYGFRKVDDCFYENDNFKRGCESLLKNMIRKHPNRVPNQSASLVASFLYRNGSSYGAGPMTSNHDNNDNQTASNSSSTIPFNGSQQGGQLAINLPRSSQASSISGSGQVGAMNNFRLVGRGSIRRRNVSQLESIRALDNYKLVERDLETNAGLSDDEVFPSPPGYSSTDSSSDDLSPIPTPNIRSLGLGSLHRTDSNRPSTRLQQSTQQQQHQPQVDSQQLNSQQLESYHNVNMQNEPLNLYQAQVLASSLLDSFVARQQAASLCKSPANQNSYITNTLSQTRMESLASVETISSADRQNANQNSTNRENSTCSNPFESAPGGSGNSNLLMNSHDPSELIRSLLSAPQSQYLPTQIQTPKRQTQMLQQEPTKISHNNTQNNQQYDFQLPALLAQLSEMFSSFQQTGSQLDPMNSILCSLSDNLQRGAESIEDNRDVRADVPMPQLQSNDLTADMSRGAAMLQQLYQQLSLGPFAAQHQSCNQPDLANFDKSTGTPVSVTHDWTSSYAGKLSSQTFPSQPTNLSQQSSFKKPRLQDQAADPSLQDPLECTGTRNDEKSGSMIPLASLQQKRDTPRPNLKQYKRSSSSILVDTNDKRSAPTKGNESHHKKAKQEVESISQDISTPIRSAHHFEAMKHAERLVQELAAATDARINQKVMNEATRYTIKFVESLFETAQFTARHPSLNSEAPQTRLFDDFESIKKIDDGLCPPTASDRINTASENHPTNNTETAQQKIQDNQPGEIESCDLASALKILPSKICPTS